jgi:hypothetical protein
MSGKAVLLYVFGSPVLFISWLQQHLLPCPFKYLTGIDCPGCGFQRAVITLMQGHISQSFLIYPPAIPVLLLGSYSIARIHFKLDDSKGTVKNSFVITVCAIVLVTYGLKLWGRYHV